MNSEYLEGDWWADFKHGVKQVLTAPGKIVGANIAEVGKGAGQGVASVGAGAGQTVQNVLHPVIPILLIALPVVGILGYSYFKSKTVSVNVQK